MMTFQLPSGVIVPNGKQEGDTFQAMATFKLMDGGDVELCQVDGENLPGYKEDSDDSPNEEANDDASDEGQTSLQQMLLGSVGGGAPPTS